MPVVFAFLGAFLRVVNDLFKVRPSMQIKVIAPFRLFAPVCSSCRVLVRNNLWKVANDCFIDT